MCVFVCVCDGLVVLVGRSACQPSAYVCVFFLCQVTVHRWMGALNAHTFCFHEFCVCHKHVCAFTQSVCVCVCVCVCVVEQRLCVSSGVPSVSLSLITV